MKKILILCLFLFGCKSSEKLNEGGLWEGTGSIQLGFETSSFHPNNLNEHWWLSFATDSAYNTYMDYAGPAEPIGERISFHKRVTCKIKGQLSKPGKYGHLGMYDRTVKIEEIKIFENDMKMTFWLPLMTVAIALILAIRKKRRK